MTKYCPNCGAGLRDWFVYCEKCGMRIDELPKQEYEPAYESVEEPVYEEELPRDVDKVPSDRRAPEFKPHSKNNEFETILKAIDVKFDPRTIESEDDFKKQLLLFLKTTFPNEIQGYGHTTIGGEVDVVIDGTYALKIKFIKNEGGMIFLVDLMMEYKHDFNDSAVVLIDVGELTSNKIEEYVNEYRELGIKTVLKKAWVKKKEEDLNVPWPQK